MEQEEPTHQVSTWLIRPVLAALRARAIDPDPLLSRAGLALAQVRAPNGKMPRAAMLRLFELCLEVTSDPTFGLCAAELYEPGANVFDYAGITSPTLEAALTRVCRYATLVDQALRPKLEVEGPLAKVIFRVHQAAALPPYLAEFMVGVGMMAARHWVGQDFPVEVRFRHPRPEDVRAHQRVLRGLLRFDSAEDAIVFAKVALSVPLRGAEPDLLPALDAQALKLLAQTLHESTPLPERVRELLRGELEHGSPTTERIAEKLRMSERTLRRRLADHHISLKELLDSLRQDLALSLLSEPRATIEDVALRLGFSDATAFHRAFRRWTGKTPGEHLRRKGSKD